MRNRLFIIAVLAIGMATCFGSCKKKTVEPTSDPTPTPTENYVCEHDSLIFVAAMEPTGEENGCIAHYICGRCGEKFADASATTPVENTILWATNYAFDNYNIIEKDFARWAGDEPYLLRACRGKLGNSGWENWTDAQWEEYWSEMNELYYEWGGQEQLDANAVPLTGCTYSNFISRIIKNKNLDTIVKNIMPFFEDEEDEQHVHWSRINARLDTIMRKLDDIQNSINALTDLVKTEQYRNMLQRRYEKQVGMMNLTYDYFNRVLRLIASEGDSVGYGKLSAATKAKIKNLAEAWHNTPVGGTNPELQLMNMLQFMKGDFVTETTLPGVYDYIAYHDAPWEHQAYTFREMTRTADVIVMAECYLMNLIYYETHRDVTFIHQNTINILMAEYAYILNKNVIVYHYDRYICQIPDAVVNVKKSLKKISSFDYFGVNTNFVLTNASCNKMAIDLLPTGTVNYDWFSKIVQYYKARGDAQTEKNYLFDKLKSVGFGNVPDNADNCWTIANHNMEKEYDGNLGWRCRMFCYGLGNGDGEFGYHTAIDKKTGGCIIKHECEKMDLENTSVWQYNKDHVVKNRGIKTADFYAIELQP